MHYVSANRIREIDKIAQEKFSIPSLILMENAGSSVFREIQESFIKTGRKLERIACICGKGNNGGDGFVAARHARCEGIRTDVFITSESSNLKGDPLINLRSLKKLGVRIIEIKNIDDVKKLRKKFNYDCIIDAIFGTGFSGEMPNYIASIINFINEINVPVFSVDVPSGLDATSGKVYDTAVKAHKTVTFGAPKIGFIKNDGAAYTGEVAVKNISYPKEILR